MGTEQQKNEQIVSAQTDSRSMQSSQDIKLSWREKICYGFGDLGNGFMFDLGQAYLTKFYTDICLISPGVVSLIFAVTKIFDAFMDPIAGAFVDGRKKIGKHGRFRPVMMVSAVILAVLTVVTFTAPDIPMAGKIAYALITYMIWGVVYSFTNVPYGSLATVMTRDVDDRAHMASTRQAGSLCAQLITGVAFIPLVLFFAGGDTLDGNPHGYTIAAVVMGLCGIAGFAICFFGNARAYPYRSTGRGEGCGKGRQEVERIQHVFQGRFHQQEPGSSYPAYAVYHLGHEHQQHHDGVFLPVQPG